jgi:hypothetical protein
MPNNNIADISKFESIQSEQHDRAISSMSVFNDLATVKKTAETWSNCVRADSQASDKWEKLDDEAVALKKVAENALKEYQKLQDNTIKAFDTFEKELKEESFRISKLPDGNARKKAKDELAAFITKVAADNKINLSNEKSRYVDSIS